MKCDHFVLWPGLLVIGQQAFAQLLELGVNLLARGISLMPGDDLLRPLGKWDCSRKLWNHLLDLAVVEDGAVGFIA